MVKEQTAQNHHNVSELGDMSSYRIVFQCANTIKSPAQHVGLVQSRIHHISSNITCSCHNIA